MVTYFCEPLETRAPADIRGNKETKLLYLSNAINIFLSEVDASEVVIIDRGGGADRLLVVE